MKKPYKIDGSTILELAYVDVHDGTVFVLRMPHHDIIIGKRTKDYYGDIEDAKQIINEINKRLRKQQ